MARGRMISKAISLDEKVNSLSDDTCRLLFTWMITHLDCEGRMHGDPVTVKSIVFPRRSISPRKVDKYLKELEKSELLFRYSVDGNQYLCAPNFEKHQVGLRKSQESASQIPPSTTELKRGNVVLAPTQIKTKVEIKTKEEVKEESVVDKIMITKESVLDAYRESIGETYEDIENEIDLACRKFTPEWVADAIREAVKRKRGDWPYIAGILKNWERFGREPRNRGSPEKHKKVDLSRAAVAEVNRQNKESKERFEAEKRKRQHMVQR